MLQECTSAALQHMVRSARLQESYARRCCLALIEIYRSHAVNDKARRDVQAKRQSGIIAIAAAGFAQYKSAIATPKGHRASPASGRAVKRQDSCAGLPAFCETCKDENSIHHVFFVCVHRPGHSRCLVIVFKQNSATKLRDKEGRGMKEEGVRARGRTKGRREGER